MSNKTKPTYGEVQLCTSRSTKKGGRFLEWLSPANLRRFWVFKQKLNAHKKGSGDEEEEEDLDDEEEVESPPRPKKKKEKQQAKSKPKKKKQPPFPLDAVWQCGMCRNIKDREKLIGPKFIVPTVTVRRHQYVTNPADVETKHFCDQMSIQALNNRLELAEEEHKTLKEEHKTLKEEHTQMKARLAKLEKGSRTDRQKGPNATSMPRVGGEGTNASTSEQSQQQEEPDPDEPLEPLPVADPAQEEPGLDESSEPPEPLVDAQQDRAPPVESVDPEPALDEQATTAAAKVPKPKPKRKRSHKRSHKRKVPAQPEEVEQSVPGGERLSARLQELKSRLQQRRERKGSAARVATGSTSSDDQPLAKVKKSGKQKLATIGLDALHGQIVEQQVGRSSSTTTPEPPSPHTPSAASGFRLARPKQTKKQNKKNKKLLLDDPKQMKALIDRAAKRSNASSVHSVRLSKALLKAQEVNRDKGLLLSPSPGPSKPQASPKHKHKHKRPDPKIASRHSPRKRTSTSDTSGSAPREGAKSQQSNSNKTPLPPIRRLMGLPGRPACLSPRKDAEDRLAESGRRITQSHYASLQSQYGRPEDQTEPLQAQRNESVFSEFLNTKRARRGEAQVPPAATPGVPPRRSVRLSQTPSSSDRSQEQQSTSTTDSVTKPSRSPQAVSRASTERSPPQIAWSVLHMLSPRREPIHDGIWSVNDESMYGVVSPVFETRSRSQIPIEDQSFSPILSKSAMEFINFTAESAGDILEHAMVSKYTLRYLKTLTVASLDPQTKVQLRMIVNASYQDFPRKERKRAWREAKKHLDRFFTKIRSHIAEGKKIWQLKHWLRFEGEDLPKRLLFV